MYMFPPPLPLNETARLQSLRDTEILDTPPEERFDRLTRLTQRLFGADIALVSLVDENRQWFKSRQGLNIAETPRDVSFCGHAILDQNIFQVPDARLDSRFANNPLVIGEPLIRSYAGAPIRTAARYCIGTLCIIDYKPRKLTSEQLVALRDLADCVEAEINQYTALEQRRIERMKSEFVSTVNDELRTPLTSITGAIGLLSSGATGVLSDAQRELIRIADNNCQRLNALVNDLLDMDKLFADQLPFDIKLQPLAPIIHRAVGACLDSSEKKGVTLVVKNTLADVMVLADAERLLKVMCHVVLNAIKFSPVDSTVEILVAPINRLVRVTIVDQGPGIPMEFRERIFSTFTQVDSSSTRQAGGAGIGLAVSRALVEKMGGRIEFESNVGVGTRFMLDLACR